MDTQMKVPPRGWQRALARPVGDRKTGEVMRDLHDARAYIIARNPPANARHWQRAMELLLVAADGGDIEAVTKQIELAMMLEGRLRFDG
jgi:hypothetical protein